MGKHIWHLCLFFYFFYLYYCCQGTQIGAQRGQARLSVCVSNMTGVATCDHVSVCLDWRSCYVCIISSTHSIKSSSPTLSSPPVTQNKAQDPILYSIQRSNATAKQQLPNEQQQSIQMHHKEIEQEDDQNEAPHSCRPQQSQIRCIFVGQDKREKANILQDSKFYIYNSFS